MVNGAGGVGLNPTISLPADVVLTNSLTAPLLFGGSAVGSDLTLAGTSSGAPNGADVIIPLASTGKLSIGPSTHRLLYDLVLDRHGERVTC